MVTDSEKMISEFKEPHILITDKKISSIKEILPLLETLANEGKKDLVIIADDIDGEALATLVVNKIRGTFNTLAIKAPGYGDRKKEMLEDIAIMTGGKVISEDVGIKLDSIDKSMLGKARRVISDKDNTTVVGGKGSKSDIEDRIKQLKAQIESSESSFDKEKLEERLGKLTGGIAIIKVGAPTESAQKELKQRVEDAVAATRAAMEEGIIPGGGIALYNVARKFEKKDKKDDDSIESHSRKILMKAMEGPLNAIIENSGLVPEDILLDLEEARDTLKADTVKNWRGFNGITNKIEDLKKAGIIDPLKVTKTAFINAVSVASNYLTIGAAVTDIPKKDDDAVGGMPPGGMPGMGY